MRDDLELDPFFIVSSPRSGSTLLRLLLNSHSSIVVPPECSFITWLAPEFADWAREDNSGIRLSKFLQSLNNARKFDTWGLAIDLVERRISDRLPDTYASLCLCVIEAFCEATNQRCSRWGDKNTNHIREIELLQGVFPNAKFIWLTRDLRDVAVSSIEASAVKTTSAYAPSLSQSPEVVGKAWRLENIAMLSRIESGQFESRIRWIRYEDLVRQTQQTLEYLFDFIGVSYEPVADRFWAENRDLNTEPVETMDWKLLTREPVREDRVGRWSNVMSQEESRLLLDFADGLEQLIDDA